MFRWFRCGEAEAEEEDKDVFRWFRCGVVEDVFRSFRCGVVEEDDGQKMAGRPQDRKAWRELQQR